MGQLIIFKEGYICCWFGSASLYTARTKQGAKNVNLNHEQYNRVHNRSHRYTALPYRLLGSIRILSIVLTLSGTLGLRILAWMLMRLAIFPTPNFVKFARLLCDI